MTELSSASSTNATSVTRLQRSSSTLNCVTLTLTTIADGGDDDAALEVGLTRELHHLLLKPEQEVVGGDAARDVGERSGVRREDFLGHRSSLAHVVGSAPSRRWTCAPEHRLVY